MHFTCNIKLGNYYLMCGTLIKHKFCSLIASAEYQDQQNKAGNKNADGPVKIKIIVMIGSQIYIRREKS